MGIKESQVASIKVVKPSQRPKRDVREKACATCGRVFSLEPEQKFFDCPACYKKKVVEQRPKKNTRTTVLTKIQCFSCGASEFVRFVPEDPKSVLCRPCFAKRAREQKINK
ncbi:MAG: hypothetical protein FWG02_09285 [Holophagaceae bacterium]|nr:hypothetical protein [Holophagaceae bacterium]